MEASRASGPLTEADLGLHTGQGRAPARSDP